MIKTIQGKVKEIIFECCERYAIKRNMDIENVQLILGLNEKGNGNTYKICEEFQPKEAITFLGVLGVDIDMKGYSLIAPQFITKSLIRFSGSYKIDLDKIKVMCVPQLENKKPDILLFVYNGSEFVEEITFTQLFRDQDLEIPT